MAHTRQSKQIQRDRRKKRPRNDASVRRTLRREVPSTVGLLADEQDFTAMRRYRTFTFDDHTRYLQQIDALLKSLASRQLHTTVALFDPEDFTEFCAEAGLDPDAAASRSRFTAEITGRGASVPYTGQHLDSLVPQLINKAVRQATWEYATMLLADLGECADCGQDIGRAAFDRASRILMRLLEEAGPGTHHLVCSVQAPDEQLLAVLHAEGAPAQLDASEGAEFVTVLAAGIALESPGGAVLRTSAPGAPDHLHGWRLHQGRLLPLTAGEVFSAYCTDAVTGEPISPEPGVEYCAGFDITTDDPENHH
ncbi:hypothetical protein SLUN_06145 [Streptomyces lunaelactis]|uniref:Uncharacterized protein n=1 Tax=Streptomyces lunaelactis TaxID=1535768 RepID=A0A2R4SY72_9ACTN|nr:hypothetical protein [Streptomyces lunaelactis]AVZ71835.1 hypothetical protein SLUN_06145 [Streptomyces lunaelactis]NUK89452.1 hypothetical protein [Streptomyces lunaelactis]NUL07254.1 hypothetical protein [Streptomyces lunaelactis]